MPLYEYECTNGHRFEVIQKFSDPPLEACTTCGQPVHKLQASPAFQFKGSGWYITDYAKKDAGGKSDKGEKGEKSEAAKDKEPSASGEKTDTAAKKESSESASKTEAPASPTPAKPSASPPER